MRNVTGAVALIFLLSLTWLAVKIALAGASIGLVSAGRVGFTVLALWLLARYGPGHTEAPPSPINTRDAALLSVAGVSGYTALSTLAVAWGGTLLPSLIVATGPIWVLFMQRLAGKTHIAASALTGTLLAVAGTVGFIWAGSSGVARVSLPSVAAAVAAVVLMSLYMVRFSALTRDYHGPMAPVITPIYAWGLLPLALWGAWDLANGARLTATAFAVLVALGLAIYLPVYLLQHRLLATIGAHTVSLLGLAVSPLVGFETAALALAPWPSPAQWVMVALTLAGMVAVIGPRARRA